MDRTPALEELLPSLPPVFFEQIVKDIPTDAWMSAFHDIPTLRDAVWEGLSTKPDKWPRLFPQPGPRSRLLRALRAGGSALEEILNVWGLENLPVVAFLEMLDREFLLDNLGSIKDLVGPERFVAGLYLLGRLEDPGFSGKIDEEFWHCAVSEETVEPLVPFGHILKNLLERFPGARPWLGRIGAVPAEAAAPGPMPDDVREPAGRLHREEERRKKVELKLEKTRVEHERLQGEITRVRGENEELRKNLSEWENNFNRRVEEALDLRREEWHARFRVEEVRPLEDAARRLDSVLKRAERAFELQRQADDQYGVVPAVRRQLLQVVLHLKEIERIYADSLMVHPEVSRVKDALVKERKRLLQLPGIEKVLRAEPSLAVAADLREHVHLLDAAPENLPRIVQLQSIVTRLADMELIEDAQPLQDDLRRKNRQIMEALYDSFHPPQEALPANRSPRNLDEFVRSGEGKKYDVYVDGYNILLKLQHAGGGTRPPSLAAHREAFIEAACAKASLFRKVFMVFDGVEDSRDLRRNVEIVYTDKSRGNTADTAIIQMIRRRKDSLALLVTRDLEIIRATENRVFALIDPYHFYTFVFDVYPPAGR
ncbi:MAG: NYN domain-containing protein [Syntrophobacteraceae bacterium]